jgi:hypothetical protein
MSNWGGARQGTPGKAYGNRTDLNANHDMSMNTAATGGMEAPSFEASVLPEDSPNLTDPTMRPGEPVTAGMGPGGQVTADGFDPRLAETRRVAEKWLPYLRPLQDSPNTGESTKVLIRYLRGVM